MKEHVYFWCGYFLLYLYNWIGTKKFGSHISRKMFMEHVMNSSCNGPEWSWPFGICILAKPVFLKVGWIEWLTLSKYNVVGSIKHCFLRSFLTDWGLPPTHPLLHAPCWLRPAVTRWEALRIIPCGKEEMLDGKQPERTCALPAGVWLGPSIYCPHTSLGFTEIPASSSISTLSRDQGSTLDQFIVRGLNSQKSRDSKFMLFVISEFWNISLFSDRLTESDFYVPSGALVY